MGALGENPRWGEAFPWLVRTGQDWKLRRLLEETETIHRSSAARLRALGQDDQARRAERFAAWVRLDLDEPEAARRLYAASRDLREVARPGLLFGKILEGALTLAGADRGNVQVLDRATGSLRIVAQAGFGAEFLEYFAVVDDTRSACGRAARERIQTVVVDVDIDEWFAPHRDIAAAAAFRAVQSTPLIERGGRLLGVVSTHYPRPYSPSARDREIIRRYGELAGQVMADYLRNGDGETLGPAVAPSPLLGAADRRPPAPTA